MRHGTVAGVEFLAVDAQGNIDAWEIGRQRWCSTSHSECSPVATAFRSIG